MKTESYFLGSNNARRTILQRISSLEINGGIKVTISDSVSRSARQNALYWKWMTEVSESGFGGKHEDTKEGAHIICKYRFARRIIQRDNSGHWEFIQSLETEYKTRPEALMHIADAFLTTTDFTVAQMSEYMTDIERHYQSIGVDLTIPDSGLLEYANLQVA